jgi:uncharacterized repeat protein (TIGR01451 family)
MQGWLQSVRKMRGLAWAGLIVVLAAAASRGQTPWGEPPMAEGPMSPQPPAVPAPTPTLPPPTPLPPEQAAPFVPPPPVAAVDPLGPPPPVVRLRVQAPARVEPDKEIEYRLTVENVSTAAAHHVWVRDRLPTGVEDAVRAEPKNTDKKKTKEGLTDLLWDLGTLKPGEQKVIVLAIKPKGNEDVQNRAYVQFEHGQRVTTRLVKPSVRVKVTVPPQALLYQSVSFRIDVTNTGAVPLRNVIVTDELPAGLEFVDSKPQPNPEKPLTWKLGDLPPQQTRRIEYQAISKRTGKFSNQVKATAGAASATDSAAVTVGEAKLKIRVSGPPRRLVNRPIPYHITVGNLGTVPLANVQVSDELPGGVEFVSASAGGRREGGFVRWTLGDLAPGELRPLVLVLRAPAPGWCWNEAKVQAGRDLSDKDRSNATRIESANAPVIEIEKSTNWLVVGQKQTYTIRLFNPGKNNVLHPSVRVVVPDQMSITAERGATTGERKGQQIHFDKVAVLDAGEEKVYTIEVEAKKAGEATLRAWWTDGRQDTGPTETWEDETIILDLARVTSRIASRARTLQARYLFGTLTRHIIGTLARPRSPFWTLADPPVTIR